MKNILLCLLLSYLSTAIQAQEDFDYVDPQTSIDWGNSLYDNFFANGCITLKSAKGQRTVHPYNQCADPTHSENNWFGDNYGINCTECGGQCSICNRGCAMTCCAMILKASSYNQNPRTWNQYLIDNKGYTCIDKCPLKCLITYPPLATYTANVVYYVGPIKGGTSETQACK